MISPLLKKFGKRKNLVKVKQKKTCVIKIKKERLDPEELLATTDVSVLRRIVAYGSFTICSRDLQALVTKLPLLPQ